MLALCVGLVGALVLPPLLFVNRLLDTWTTNYTAQLLGGFLGICGGSLAMLAVLIGAGLFARLAGWRAPRHPVEPPLPYAQPPATLVEGQWRDVTPALPGPVQPPPWGVTGGGDYDLLSPPAKDRRFSLTQSMRSRHYRE